MRNNFESNLHLARQVVPAASDSAYKNYSDYKELYDIAGTNRSAEHDKYTAQAIVDSPDMRGLSGFLGKRAAREVVRDANGAIEIFNDFNTATEAAYAPGSKASLKAYQEAISEDKNRELQYRNSKLAFQADSLSDALEISKKAEHFDTMGNFDKLNFIFNFAQNLSKDKEVSYLKSKKNSVTIDGSYLVKDRLEIGGKSYGDPYTAVMDLVTRITKVSDDLFEIDMIDSSSKNLDPALNVIKARDKLTTAYDRRAVVGYNDLRRAGYILAKKKVDSNKSVTSTESNPNAKIIVRKNGSGTLITKQWSNVKLPSAIKLESLLVGKKQYHGNVFYEKPADKKAVADLVNLLSETWIHGVFALPGLY